jgi:hypothetical protein
MRALHNSGITSQDLSGKLWFIPESQCSYSILAKKKLSEELQASPDSSGGSSCFSKLSVSREVLRDKIGYGEFS